MQSLFQGLGGVVAVVAVGGAYGEASGLLTCSGRWLSKSAVAYGRIGLSRWRWPVAELVAVVACTTAHLLRKSSQGPGPNRPASVDMLREKPKVPSDAKTARGAA